MTCFIENMRFPICSWHICWHETYDASTTFAEGLLESPRGPGFRQIQLDCEEAVFKPDKRLCFRSQSNHQR
jgi:hypothetical protein